MSDRHHRIHITYDTAAGALGRMTEADRDEMIALADYLAARIRDMKGAPKIGRMAALELLAAIGVDMVKPTIPAKELQRLERFTAK